MCHTKGDLWPKLHFIHIYYKFLLTKTTTTETKCINKIIGMRINNTSPTDISSPYKIRFSDKKNNTKILIFYNGPYTNTQYPLKMNDQNLEIEQKKTIF